MSSKALGNLMRVSVLAAGVCGIFLCVFVIPSWGRGVISADSTLEGWFWPWLVFAWLFVLPCFAILVYVWRVSGAVISETVFTLKTARWVKTGAVLTFADAALLFAGNIVLLALRVSHPSVLLVCVIADVFMLALALLAAVLSRYLTKAAALQEESEGTL